MNTFLLELFSDGIIEIMTNDMFSLLVAVFFVVSGLTIIRRIEKAF